MSVEELLCKICSFLDAILKDGFGDQQDSKSDDVALTDAWVPIVTISRPSVLRLYNASPANELMLSVTGRDGDMIGGRMPHGVVEIWDRFEGSLYAKNSVAGSNATLNFMLIPRRFSH